MSERESPDGGAPPDVDAAPDTPGAPDQVFVDMTGEDVDMLWAEYPAAL